MHTLSPHTYACGFRCCHWTNTSHGTEGWVILRKQAWTLHICVGELRNLHFSFPTSDHQLPTPQKVSKHQLLSPHLHLFTKNLCSPLNIRILHQNSLKALHHYGPTKLSKSQFPPKLTEDSLKMLRHCDLCLSLKLRLFPAAPQSFYFFSYPLPITISIRAQICLPPPPKISDQ